MKVFKKPYFIADGQVGKLGKLCLKRGDYFDPGDRDCGWLSGDRQALSGIGQDQGTERTPTRLGH
jgi:hypothetical protein